MNLKASCPCGGKFVVTEEQAGQQVRCPHCGEVLVVPEEAFDVALRESPGAAPPADPPSPPTTKARPVRVHIRPHASGVLPTQPHHGIVKRRSVRPHVIVVAVATLLFLGLAVWAVLRFGNFGPLGRGQPRVSADELQRILPGAVRLGSTPAGAAVRAPPPAAPELAPPVDAGGKWDLSRKAVVEAHRFGPATAAEAGDAPYGARITDLAVDAAGRVYACGSISTATAIPKAEVLTRLTETAVGRNSGFVACFSPDARTLAWFSVLGSGVATPSRLAVAPDGGLFVGGQTPDRGTVEELPRCLNKEMGREKNCRAVLFHLPADGSRLDWIRFGGPSMDDVSGLAAETGGTALYTGGATTGGKALSVRRVGPDGNPGNFPEAGASTNAVEAVSLSADDAQLKETYFAFYAKGYSEGFDYDGEGGNAPVRFDMRGPREGGQVVVLPGGDFVVTAAVQYDYRIGAGIPRPSFDLLVARYAPSGKLKWATNLYRPGDSVHSAEEKPVDLAVDPASGDLLVLASQHGSNEYRLPGDLVGDAGNLAISWVGRVEATNGTAKAGWYFMNNRLGHYDADGKPLPPPEPQLVGNTLRAVRADGRGRVYLAGAASARMFTTPQAEQPWHPQQGGGNAPCLVVLDPPLARTLYATTIRGVTPDSAGTFNGLAVTAEAVVLGGEAEGPSYDRGAAADWGAASDEVPGASLVRVTWPKEKP